ncbi:MAG TPA: methyltransferase domain-containing protein [Bryobacteraceae bacterium]|jgi:SAM-dependent methyltransferase|nr:methyltransferase domain-containing protein [Bryobacteraceae bacterium]
MARVTQREQLDDPNLPDAVARLAYREIARIHRWLGNEWSMIRAIRRNPVPVRRILDVGCGAGFVLSRIARAVGAEAIGVDIRAGLDRETHVTIVRADACYERLPEADVALCMCLCHHMEPDELIAMIRNVGCYCRRFIILDLVRSRLPLGLFRLFVTPFVSRITADDGIISIKRSYRAHELRELAERALAGTQATFRCHVAPFQVRQMVDIDYGHGFAETLAAQCDLNAELA